MGYKVVSMVNTMIDEFVENEDFDNFFQSIYSDLRINILNDTINDFNDLSFLNHNHKLFLERYLKNIEIYIEGLLSKIPFYDAIFWSRRMKMTNMFNRNNHTLYLYKGVLNSSIYKYCNNEVSNIEIEGNKFPKSCETSETISHILKTLYIVEILAYMFTWCQQRYRILQKGGILQFYLNLSGDLVLPTGNDGITKFGFNVSSQTEDVGILIDLYDSRLSKINIGSYAGINIDINIQTAEDKYIIPYFLPSLYTKEKWLFKELFICKNKWDWDTKYYIYMLNLGDIYKYYSNIDEFFLEKQGFTFKMLIYFLKSLLTNLMPQHREEDDLQARRIYNISYTGYQLFENPDIFRQKIFFRFYNLVKLEIGGLSKKTSLEVFEKIFKYFVYIDADDISLYTRGPKKLLRYINDNCILVDYTSIQDEIASLLKSIVVGSQGEINNLYGTGFENIVTEEIKSIFHENSNVVKGVIKNSHGSKKEIDASFVIEDILFIVEVKGVNVSFDFDQGNIEYRLNQIKKKLKLADEKVTFIGNDHTYIIKTYLKGLNINYVVPLLLTNYPEYIWDYDDNLFLSKENNLPRILTLDEIKQIKELDLDEVRKAKYTLIL